MHSLKKVFVVQKDAIYNIHFSKNVLVLKKYIVTITAWIMLGDPDANFSVQDFIECAARLKGNLLEKLKNFRNDLIPMQTEMTERPEIVPMSKDIEFDLSLVMDPASRRIYDQLRKRPLNQDQHVPHFYRQCFYFLNYLS